MATDNIKTGKTYIRIAASIFTVPILIHFLIFFIPALDMRLWPQFKYVVFASELFLLGFIFSFAFLWFCGFWVLRMFSALCYRLFGKSISMEKWVISMAESLWVLPLASAIGAVLYSMHYIFGIAGWPYDFIYGTIGTVLGVWCFGAIFYGWFKLGKEAA